LFHPPYRACPEKNARTITPIEKKGGHSKIKPGMPVRAEANCALLVPFIDCYVNLFQRSAELFIAKEDRLPKSVNTRIGIVEVNGCY